MLVSSGRLGGKSASFNILSIAGGALLAVGGWAVGAWPSVTLDLIWIVIGLGALTKRTSRSEEPFDARALENLGEAAVDDDDIAGHVGVAQTGKDRFRAIVGSSGTPQRGGGGHARMLSTPVLRPRRDDQAGSNGVASYRTI